MIGSLRAQRATISQHVADLEGRYGPNHPEMLTAKRQLADTDAQIQAEINRIVSNLEAKAQVSRQRVASLEGTLGTARGSLQQNNRAMIGLDDLERKATTSQTLYESYLNRLKESSAEEGTERSDARVISGARIPLAPSSPKVLLDVALAIFLGLGSGAAAAFIAEAMASGFTTGEEVEQRLGQHYLGGIPLLASLKGAGKVPLTAVVKNPMSAYAEAFRSLRTAIRYSGHGISQVVAVSSALPAEGKNHDGHLSCSQRSLSRTIRAHHRL